MGSKVVRRGLVAIGIGGVLLLAACSSTSTQVSDEIAAQVKDQLDLSSEPAVTCPDDAKAGEGETFTCDIDLDDGTLPVEVTFKDDTNFTTTVDGAVYKKSELDGALKASLAKGEVTVKAIDCTGSKLVVIGTGDTVTCTATATDGTTADIKVGLDKSNEAKTVGAVYEEGALITFVTNELTAANVGVASMDCGDVSLIQAVEDTTIECQVTDANATQATVTVSLGQDGTAKIENITTN